MTLFRHTTVRKKFISFVLAGMAAAAMLAAPTQQVEAAKSVKEIQNEKNKLQDQIDDLQSQLTGLLSDIDVLQSQIADNQSQISDAQYELQQAEESRQKQYDAMKLRIRYTYENSQKSVFSILLESDSFSDFLNRVEYTNSVYTSDRELLSSYESTCQEIEDMKAELESEQTQLANQESQLEAKQSSLNSLIESKQGQMADFDQQLAEAKAAAAKKAAEEKAAAERAQAAANAAAVSTSSSSSSSKADVGANPAPKTSVGGSSVVSYAKQFVGNPYVWGGDSLTGGCDCSGFVVQVYKHFGIDLSGSRNSAALRSVGSAVSYENIQPGDIVCYPGHVGIYAGGGVIVEAQSSKAGITANRSVTCHPILAIRRVI